MSPSISTRPAMKHVTRRWGSIYHVPACRDASAATPAISSHFIKARLGRRRVPSNEIAVSVTEKAARASLEAACQRLRPDASGGFSARQAAITHRVLTHRHPLRLTPGHLCRCPLQADDDIVIEVLMAGRTFGWACHRRRHDRGHSAAEDAPGEAVAAR